MSGKGKIGVGYMGEEDGCGEKRKIRQELRKHVHSSINVHSSSFLKRLKRRESGRKMTDLSAEIQICGG